MDQKAAPQIFFDSALPAARVLRDYGDPVIETNASSVVFSLRDVCFSFTYDWRDSDVDLLIGHKVVAKGRILKEEFSLREILAAFGHDLGTIEPSAGTEEELPQRMRLMALLASKYAAPFLRNDEGAFAIVRNWQEKESDEFLGQ